MSWFERAVVDAGRLPLFLCFLSFVLTFVVTRTITRLIRAGRGPFADNVSESGLHVHHAVPGVVLLVTGSFIAVGSGGQTGWAEFAAILVGIGTSLVLDEFALILRLDDVYWSEEGRLSVQVTALAIAALGMALVGFRPFHLGSDDSWGDVALTVVVVVMHLVWVVVTVTKGKLRLALFAAFIPLLGPIGAIRLARPNSPWAVNRYGPAKMERARKRFAAHSARWDPVTRRASDLVAGPADDHAGA